MVDVPLIMKQRTRIRSMLMLVGLCLSLYSVSQYAGPLMSVASSLRSGNALPGLLAGGLGGDAAEAASLLDLVLKGSLNSDPAATQLVETERLIASLQAIGLNDQQVALFSADLMNTNGGGLTTVTEILNRLQKTEPGAAALSPSSPGRAAPNGAADLAAGFNLSDAQLESLAALLSADGIPSPIAGTSESGSSSEHAAGSARVVTRSNGSTLIMGGATGAPPSAKEGANPRVSGRSRTSAPSDMTAPAGHLTAEEAGELMSSAQALHAKGEIEAAITAYRQILNENPRASGTHLNLALAYYQQNDDAAAWRHVHAAQDLGREAHPKFVALLIARTPDPRSSH